METVISQQTNWLSTKIVCYEAARRNCTSSSFSCWGRKRLSWRLGSQVREVGEQKSCQIPTCLLILWLMWNLDTRMWNYMGPVVLKGRYVYNTVHILRTCLEVLGEWICTELQSLDFTSSLVRCFGNHVSTISILHLVASCVMVRPSIQISLTWACFGCVPSASYQSFEKYSAVS